MSATPPQDPSPEIPGAGEPYTMNQPRIVDRCPACGSRSLFIGAGGFLTCSVITCANPATGDAIESLRAELSTARASLEAFNSYAGAMGLLRSIVDEHYPAEVFDASSGDQGALMVAAARKLVEAHGRIAEVEHLARKYLHIAGPSLGGTDYVERLAVRFDNPYDCGREAEEERCRRRDVLLAPSIEAVVRLGSERDAALAQVTALREALEEVARQPCIQRYLHESRPCARGECGPCIAIKTLRKVAALAPAVTATPSQTEEVMRLDSVQPGAVLDVTGAAHPSNTPTGMSNIVKMEASGMSRVGVVTNAHGEVSQMSFAPPAPDFRTVLAALVAMIHEHESRGEAADFLDNEGCPDCTHGTVPDRSNKGRCPYHSAVELLRETEGK